MDLLIISQVVILLHKVCCHCLITQYVLRCGKGGSWARLLLRTFNDPVHGDEQCASTQTFTIPCFMLSKMLATAPGSYRCVPFQVSREKNARDGNVINPNNGRQLFTKNPFTIERCLDLRESLEVYFATSARRRLVGISFISFTFEDHLATHTELVATCRLTLTRSLDDHIKGKALKFKHQREHTQDFLTGHRIPEKRNLRLGGTCRPDISYRL
ncbi:hypothetical protein J6590_031232 [Homalodisca vitripennis]|nr:hypothetical protein J6590_031232 [Homalodisca vitripennis]